MKDHALQKSQDTAMASEQPQYEARVKRKRLQQIQPELAMPQSEDAGLTSEPVMADPGSGMKAYLMTLAMGLLAFIGFSAVNAYSTIVALLNTQPLLGGFLSLLLMGFIVLFLKLMWGEWRGVRSLKQLTNQSESLSLQGLQDQGDKKATLKILKQRAKLQNASPFCRQCYQTFFSSLRDHHSNAEVLAIFDDKVQKPLLKKAKSSLKKDSIAAGGISLVSPNSTIQTLAIIWLSLRTLRRISYVYGVRPSLIGNFRLLRIALENLAANSLTDLVTDEIANQLGGSLGDKILSNSVDAITAAGLNQRLGKALI